ncbi:NAD(P)-dependent oxidoreductase [Halobacteriovorax sp. HLS]|uniref:NAD-dependent epimerase/dehydratase family protein n=1 Tax=Halobacteriovorax sp. HLS TaxID=2234000 RepID=UPI000FD98C47|nr:NAD(P)-dependent oxidoreductase [Halobacteriovorax sp. HLS]
MKKILLLGSSGWIAHYLIPSLQKHISECNILGSRVTNTSEHSIENFIATSSDLDIIDQKIKVFNPDIIINMTRGEDDDAFTMHKYLIDRCKSSSIHYNYFSSFNALDANISTEHYEDELPNAQTDYGLFKARCEEELFANGSNFSIFRFGATHGWAPNSKSRTELFLEHMLSGESLPIDAGVLQNRLATNHMADMMAAVLKMKGEGVFHFGAVDGSEEIDFLRDLAESFGYPREQVTLAGTNQCNALMIPERTLQLIGKEYEKTEADTIKAVRHMIRLSSYIL